MLHYLHTHSILRQNLAKPSEAKTIGNAARRVIRLTALSLLVSLVSVGGGLVYASEQAIDGPPRVELITSEGTIILELEDKRAPLSTSNFLSYVNKGFYDNTIFHRVIESFMIQGGGFTPDFQKKPTDAPIKNEANNGLKNHHYTIAMARTNAPHSATAQFFINTTNENDFLDYTAATQRGWGYAVFGRVVAGKDVVDRISRVPTGPGGPFSRDAPQSTVLIESARLLTSASEDKTNTQEPVAKGNGGDTDSETAPAKSE